MEHARLSPSGAHRWLKCPASIKEEEKYPDIPNPESIFGTAAHALAEKCLMSQSPAKIFEGKTFEDVVVDARMVKLVQVYIDFVQKIPGQLFIEQKVRFDDWIPDGFGTSDAIIINANETEYFATIVDLKTGRSEHVIAKDNAQLKLYALGVFSMYDFIYDFAYFDLIIAQVSLYYVSKWRIRRAELLKWAVEAHDKALLTFADKQKFIPGKVQCQFCKAKMDCFAHNIFYTSETFDQFDDLVLASQIKKMTKSEIETYEHNVNQKMIEKYHRDKSIVC